MHRWQNQDYHRTTLTQSPHGPPLGSGAVFPNPLSGRNFPQHYPNPGVSPSPGPAHIQGGKSATAPGFQSFSPEPDNQTASLNHFQQGWTHHQPDLQSLHVQKKAEEFLRKLDAKDRLEMSEALEKTSRRQSAHDDAERRSSGPRSRGRSQGKSRGRSQARSRRRSRSKSRGKSRGRVKSQARSRSRGGGRRVARSKSQSCPEGRRGGATESASPSPSDVPDLFQNLKQILQSRELEKRLDAVRNSSAMKQQSPAEPRDPLEALLEPEMRSTDPESPAELDLNSVLPHERAGGSEVPRILSWKGPNQPRQALANNRVFFSVEDEEEFLYGEAGARKKPQAVTVPLAQCRPLESPPLAKASLLQEPRGQAADPRQPEVTPEECVKVKNMLKSIGLNLGMTDISKMAARLRRKQEEQRGGSSNQAARNTPDILKTRNKEQKSEDSQSNQTGSGHSHRGTPSIEKTVEEAETREKQIQEKRKEYLLKELEGLLKREGTGDLIPVMGFFCQRCEEFFATLSSAKGHQHKEVSPPDKQHHHTTTTKRSEDPASATGRNSADCSAARKRTRTSREKEGESDSEKSAKKKKRRKKEKKVRKEKKKEKKKKKKKKDASDKSRPLAFWTDGFGKPRPNGSCEAGSKSIPEHVRNQRRQLT